MKSLPQIDYGMLKQAQEDKEMPDWEHRLSRTPEQDARVEMEGWRKKPVGKYGNLANFLQERSGVSIDDQTLDKRLRTFFEDLITEILKNPAEWDRTRNINFMELFNYLEEQEKQPEQAGVSENL